jgi:hypothetical protein
MSLYTQVIYWVNIILNRFYTKDDEEHKYRAETQQKYNAMVIH